MTDLKNLFGLSILSPELQAFLKKYDIPDNPELPSHTKVNYYDIFSSNETKGITLTFDGYYRYTGTWGEPVHRYKGSFDELFLHEIKVKADYPTKKTFALPLPFDLQPGGSSQAVLKKIGKKQSSKCTTSYGEKWDFLFEDYKIEVAFNVNDELVWVSVKKLTLEDKKKSFLMARLKGQDKNINPANVAAIVAYSKKFPTAKWRKRRKEGDENFKPGFIEKVEELLKDYSLTLVELTNQQKAMPVYNSVKKLVNALNKINNKYESAIETLERDELAEFINTIARKTGLDIDNSIDLTEEWRQW